MTKRLITAGLLVGTLSIIAQPVFAQSGDDVTEFVPQGEIAQAKDGPRQGWDGAFSLAANVSVSQNSHVVGQVDGFSLLLGVSLLGGLDYILGKHEFRNTLTLTESWARTTVIDEFIKTNDVLTLESLYNYFLLERFGVFGRLNLDTSILPAEDVTAETVNYRIIRRDGTLDAATTSTDRLRVSDPFQPVTLAESVGVFYEPFKSEAFAVSLRAGVGARETFARGALTADDDAATPDVEVRELDNVFQGGVEVFGGIKGKAMEKRITYSVGADIMIPVLNNDSMNRGALDLTVLGFAASTRLSVFEWMAVNYVFRVRNDPQLVDEVQVQNNLLLTFKYDFIERNKVPEKPKVDPKLAAAEKAAAEAADRAEKAEEAAKAAEARAKAAEDRAKAAEDAAKEAADKAKAATEPAPEATTPEAKDPAAPAVPAKDPATP